MKINKIALPKFITPLISFLLLSSISAAQVIDHQGQLEGPIPENFFSASPDVMAFQKHNLLPVNLYTGKVNLSIPIYEIKSGSISVPISISYNSGGIKVDEFASSVGMGWTLNAGGSIVRIVKDLPDNEVGYAAHVENDWDLGVFIRPALSAQGYNRKGAKSMQTYLTWASYNKHAIYTEDMSINENLTSFAGYATAYFRKDIVPDLFVVNAPSLNTSFIAVNETVNDIFPGNNNGISASFMDNAGHKLESVIIDKRKIDGFGFYAPGLSGSHFTRATQPLKDFFEFNILDNDGVKYRFSEVEVNETFYGPLGGKPNDIYGWDNTWKTMESNNYDRRIQAWCLSSIKDVKTNSSVSFEYETYGNSFTIAHTFSNSYVSVAGGTPPNKCIFNHSPFGSNPYNFKGSFGYSERGTQRKRLKRIAFDAGEVLLNYNQEREDYPGEKVLSEIVVKDVKGKVVFKYQFKYSYVTSKENCSEPSCKRLFLDQLDFVSTNSNVKSYQFQYDNSIKLPKRTSLQQDYLGYYNNNGINGTSNATTVFKPKLYYYQDKGIHSLLPFPLKGVSNGVNIPGDIDLIPNSYSLIGLLKKVIFPSGGSTEFEYENNSFRFEGQEYISGGARIKSQKLYDNTVLVKAQNYTYTESDGKSSGYINNIPVFGYLSEYQPTPYQARKFYVYDKPKAGIELTQGSFVGYSTVTETEQNNGKTVYKFSSSKEYANIPEERQPLSGCPAKFVINSAYPSVAYIDNDFKRGFLEKKSVYDQSGSLVFEENNSYISRSISSRSLSGKFRLLGSDLEDWPIHEITISSSLPVAQNLLTQQTVVDSKAGNITKRSNFEYTTEYPFMKKETVYDSNDGVVITSRFFSKDLYQSGYLLAANLYNQNRISKPIKEQVYKGNTLLYTSQHNYDSYSGNLILPKSLSVSKSTYGMEENEVVDFRDERGNVTQYHTNGNIYHTIIWGYNYSFPIAKIANARISDVSSLLTNLQTLANSDTDNCRSADCSEQKLRQALNQLRVALPNAQIYTYTYDWLVGLTSETDPAGRTIYYEYDDFMQLKAKRDEKGQLIESYDYKYRNQ